MTDWYAVRDICLFPSTVIQAYRLITAVVHGNALGAVLEPIAIDAGADESVRRHTWEVRIGPLVPEAAIAADFPKDDFNRVIRDLKKFCEAKGINGKVP